MKDLKLIWQYIDGSCSQDEMELFRSKMNEETFAMKYQQALELHGSLVRATPMQAPPDLIEHTLLRLSHEAKFNMSNIASVSIKPLWIFITSIIIVTALILSSGMYGSTYEPLPISPDLWQFLPQINIQFPVLDMDYSMFSNLIVLAILPAIYLMDQLFGKFRLS